MKIEFGSRKLEKACKDEKLAVRTWGKARAYKVFQRLTELGAAQTLADYIRCVPGAKCHPLVQDRKGQYAVYLGQYRLIFEPSDVAPEAQENELFEARVTGVRILEVEDYHHGHHG